MYEVLQVQEYYDSLKENNIKFDIFVNKRLLLFRKWTSLLF